MYILKIIPIANGLPEKYFSYFSKEKTPVGALVEIKIKSRKIFGIVKEIKDLKEDKINIKRHKFALRKIERIVYLNFIEEKLLKSIEKVSLLLGGDEGELYSSYIPISFLESGIEKKDFKKRKEQKKEKEGKNFKKKALLMSQEKRISKYKDIFKKSIFKKETSLVFFSSINDLEFFREKVENEFEKEILILHSNQNKTESLENHKKLAKGGVKIILSTTSIFPFIFWQDLNLKTIIIEKENSFNYFSHGSKRQIDGREIIKKISEDLSLKIFLGGDSLSLSSFLEIKNGQIEKGENKKNNLHIIDMTKEDKLFESKYSKVYFSKRVVQKLEKLKEEKEGKIFLYSKRKGLFTETVCRDCSTILKCDTCDKPYILFNNKEKREYICSGCKSKISLEKNTELNCKNCNSWRLETLGVGVEGIEMNLKELGWKCFVLDSHNIKTKIKARQIIEKWQKEKLGVLIGTDLALNFLNKNNKIDLAGIISIDSLFSIPEINIDEKIINLLEDIKEKMNCEILLETRMREAKIFSYIESGDTLGFLDDELEERKSLSLPPFSKILKFKIENKDPNLKIGIEKMINKISTEEDLQNIKINWWQDKSKKTYIGMMMIKRENWEIKKEGTTLPTEFAKKIHTLLSDFKLEINPVSVY